MPSSAIVTAFRNVVSRFPEKPALISGETSVTYSELEALSASFAKQVAERVKGDTVALLIPNCISFAPAFLGALWAGKTVAVLPTLAPPPIIKMMVASVGAESVITTQDLLPKLLESGIPSFPYEIGNTGMRGISICPTGMRRAFAVLGYPGVLGSPFGFITLPR